MSRSVAASASKAFFTSETMSLSAICRTTRTRSSSSPRTTRRERPPPSAWISYVPDDEKYLRHSGFTFGVMDHSPRCRLIW